MAKLPWSMCVCVVVVVVVVVVMVVVVVVGGGGYWYCAYSAMLFCIEFITATMPIVSLVTPDVVILNAQCTT